MSTPTAERIATAAREILAAEGTAAVTMRRVAEATGITPMAIYRHYDNREVLLRAVATTAARELAEVWREPAPNEDWAARFDLLQDRFLDFAVGQPHLYRFLMTDDWAQARRFPGDFRDHGGPPLAELVRLVEEGMRTGVLREDDPLEVALTVSTQTQGMVLLYLSGRIETSEVDFRAMCHRSAWRIFDGLNA
ncbi:TetR/AcrR family transcriptional regulator [Amycolatopsis jiangsuensis]|uniref:AcrR family transcriptional regulator n=1 Tax=Amycolatopsis jiangsuensis TaxID=1181879 RepID=A0A840ISM6_9PSEU|nr:TetR/AcrR family transcriptional regulator [Amycolatopsis jiangsuensis]MBB4685436.1 AcrR family transcriptional regulator [Amycolatopsis jiangsuensis]